MSAVTTLIFTVLLSAALASALFLAMRVTKRSAWLLLLAALPLVLLYLWNPNFRVYSYHGLLHSSVVYQILNGFVPPDCSLLAGEPH